MRIIIAPATPASLRRRPAVPPRALGSPRERPHTVNAPGRWHGELTLRVRAPDDPRVVAGVASDLAGPHRARPRLAFPDLGARHPVLHVLIGAPRRLHRAAVGFDESHEEVVPGVPVQAFDP